MITARAMFISGPHDEHLEPLPLGLGEELVGLAGPVGIVRTVARHLHVAAERDDADAVLGVAALGLENLGTEAEREGEHAHAEPPRGHEVAQLVHEHQHAEDEEEREEGVHRLQGQF
jgi:hypothetical protein